MEKFLNYSKENPVKSLALFTVITLGIMYILSLLIGVKLDLSINLPNIGRAIFYAMIPHIIISMISLAYHDYIKEDSFKERPKLTLNYIILRIKLIISYIILKRGLFFTKKRKPKLTLSYFTLGILLIFASAFLISETKEYENYLLIEYPLFFAYFIFLSFISSKIEQSSNNKKDEKPNKNIL